MECCSLPKVNVCSDLESKEYDGLVVVARELSNVQHRKIQEPLKALIDLDDSAKTGCFLVPSELPSKRIIFSSPGALNKDCDDVRRFFDAARDGVKKAIKAGCKKPMLYMTGEPLYPKFDMVTILGAYDALYVPLEVREDVPNKSKKVDFLGIYGPDGKVGSLEIANEIEIGKIVCRDIGGSDPERMAAPRVEEYVRDCFKNTSINIEVVKDQDVLEKEYPCLAAVNRAANVVPRHQARVIWLTYEPEEGPVEKTYLLVGKGVTYDTGGADIKAGGIMAGMSRDKCGAAVVAGFLKTVAALKPKGVKVIGALAMVRNSVGANSYVSDEIITSRAGVRLRVGNTDAEGRMAMVDVLAHAKEKALNEVNSHLMTVATLTGHAAVAMGEYTAVMDNGAARKEQFAQSIFKTGEECGDPFEVSNIRREDYEKIFDKSGEFVEVIQCNNLPSTRTSRGHQFPAAFMLHVSGIDNHNMSSKDPLKYSHFDIAGSAGSLPGPTTASCVTSLVMHCLAATRK